MGAVDFKDIVYSKWEQPSPTDLIFPDGTECWYCIKPPDLIANIKRRCRSGWRT
jgi:hypothetical protein